MSTLVRHAVALVTALVSVPAAAQSFQYSDFTDVSALVMNGAAIQSGSNNLRIVNNGATTVGSAWYSTPVDVLDGFDTTFSYTVTGSGPAEGFAFVIHDSAMGSAAIGGDQWGLGYGDGATTGGIDNSLAIEFDFVQQSFANDRSGNEVSVHSQGVLPNTANEGASLGRSSPGINLAATRTVRVEYIPGRLKVWVDNMSNPRINIPYRLTSGGSFLAGGGPGPFQFTNGQAFVGFTASTGLSGTTKRADITSWEWESLIGPDACYDGSAGEDLLRINGSEGGFYRTVSVVSGDPFSIDVAAPLGQASSLFVLFGSLGVADGSNSVTFPQGTLCFPAAGGLIDLGVGPAPAQFAVPPGIPLDITLTLQAVIETDPLGPTLGITNAIVLEVEPGPGPVIDNVQPVSPQPGATVTVSGSNFSSAVGVEIAGIAVAPTSVSSDSIQFTAPGGLACDSMLIVTNPDTQSANFAVNPSPTGQASISFGSASGGSTVVVTGTGYGAGTTVTVGGAPASVLATSSLSVVFQTPPGTPGPTTIVVTGPGGCSLSLPFSYQ